jgi:hypothetical protein
VLSHRHVQLNRSLSHCVSQRITLTSAQPLGSRSPVLSHRHVQLNRSLSHCVSQENHLEYHIISTLCTEETSTSFHLRLRENDTPNSWASPHRGTQHSISVSERNHTPSSWASSPHTGHTTFHLRLREEPHTQLMGTHNSWASSPHTGAHNVPSPSQRGTTHPTHGLSLRPTHLVCVLEDVSRSCNHQQKTICTD